MKRMRYMFILLLFSTCTFLFAQEGNWPKVDEMHAKKWQFMVEKAQLNEKESEMVQPVFMEYEKTVWKQHAKNREFFKMARKKDGDKEKLNYSELNDRYVEMELIQAQLFKNYHQKLKKILSPEVLFRYYRAERDFKKKLLQDFPGQPGRGNRPR